MGDRRAREEALALDRRVHSDGLGRKRAWARGVSAVRGSRDRQAHCCRIAARSAGGAEALRTCSVGVSAVSPRPAASVLLVRPGQDAPPEGYMIRRPQDMPLL